ncbi:MAG: cysteine desulfurase [Parachlamydiales bacterium]|nr:cysteine desulfurase [Parachlamydiales bacterium]
MLAGMQDYLLHIGANPNRGNHQLSQRGQQMVYETRELLSQFLGIGHPNKISFTYNATYAINTLLSGFLNPFDHIITSSYDHNAVVRPLHHLSKKANITYDVWKCDLKGQFNLADLEKLLTPKTRLLIFSHASNVIGSLIPLNEVAMFARKKKIAFALDCTQTAGHIDLELESLGIDMAAGTCHKALLGPTGLGFLYIKNPDLVSPFVQGGGGFLASSLDQPETSPAKFEAGTINFLGLSALNSSLKWLSVKKNEIRSHHQQLTQHLRYELLKIPGLILYGTDNNGSIPIISFNIKDIAPSLIESYLEINHQLIVRSGLQCAPLMHEALNTLPDGAVRVSLGPFNRATHVTKLVKALWDLKSYS